MRGKEDLYQSYTYSLSCENMSTKPYHQPHSVENQEIYSHQKTV